MIFDSSPSVETKSNNWIISKETLDRQEENKEDVMSWNQQKKVLQKREWLDVFNVVDGNKVRKNNSSLGEQDISLRKFGLKAVS